MVCAGRKPLRSDASSCYPPVWAGRAWHRQIHPILRRGRLAGSTGRPMGIASDTLVTTLPVSDLAADPGPGRRLDIDAKQAQISALLHRVNCEGLLVLNPDNFAWLTSGAVARAVLDPGAL